MLRFTECEECSRFDPVKYFAELNRCQLKDLLSFLDELRSKAIADRNAIDDDIALSHRALDYSDYTNLNALGARLQRLDEIIECVQHAVPSNNK